MLKKINLIKNGEVQNEQFYSYLDLAKNENFKNNAQSFNLKYFKVAYHITYDALIDSKNNLVAMSGILAHPKYPNGYLRILNRVYIAKNYRNTESKYNFYACKYLLPMQIAEMKNNFQFLFVSRVGPNSHYFFKKLTTELNTIIPGWQICENYIKVVPESNDYFAYQKICYLSKNESENTFFSDFKSRSELIEMRNFEKND